jgi:NAD(P)-dependent dehydrogenase (short-subunit alcohol dehydrogenase family)
MTLGQKRVAITGAAGDIGLAMVRLFANSGAKVVALDRATTVTAQRELDALDVPFYSVDVTDAKKMTATMVALGPLDVAIANAGVYRGAPFLNATVEDWRLQLDVNMTGVFLFCQAAARKMVERGAGGVILITGSWVQNVPGVDGVGYCASKAGAAMLGRCMALELGEHNIRVNLVAPGIVDAGMAKRQLQVDPAFARTAARSIPLGRLQTAEQIAQAAKFLCSDEAASVTGATLLVDGGLSLFKFDGGGER